MSLRSLRNELRRLASGVGVVRCSCGAALPSELLAPRPIEWIEEIRLPDELGALEPLATPEEARELQDILNRGLDLLPDADATDWRFKFADGMDDNGPRCPACRAPVDDGLRIKFICVSGPAPDDLRDTLQSDPLLAPRFAELDTVLRRRVACSLGSTT